MSIRKPALLPRDDKKFADFVAAAPDGAASARLQEQPEHKAAAGGKRKPRIKPKPDPNETVQIALKVSQGDLDRIDAAAAKRGISRAGFFRMAAFKLIES